MVSGAVRKIWLTDEYSYCTVVDFTVDGLVAVVDGLLDAVSLCWSIFPGESKDPISSANCTGGSSSDHVRSNLGHVGRTKTKHTRIARDSIEASTLIRQALLLLVEFVKQRLDLSNHLDPC